ncbi:hypothetical protein [Paenibacillus xylanexedens]|uniref:hypothetical protein n=1 Tax=Paenibacillus xylanexedens TaxID=528191 RepID=UPI0011A3FEA6|nr:hypothetical protein [Paenibacillus xylanexedens]
MEKKIKVRLKTDLTNYLNGLKAGTEGYTIGRFGMWSRGNDNFTGVHFRGIGSLDVLWSSLEIIDEDYLKKTEERKHKRLEEFKSAKDITKYIGPRGGFKGLSFKYTTLEGNVVNYSNGFKQESEEIIQYFKDLGLSIIEKTY